MSYTQNLAVRNARGRDNIRLFRVLNSRSKNCQHMKCEVQMFSLRQTPQYSALSYCWRIDNESKPVEFQGSLRGTKMITRDLISALWTVQRRQKSDWLWVDAICIDQSEAAEKNDQVPRMQAIYENAHHVIVWLGEAVPSIGLDSVEGSTGNFDEYTAFGLTDGKVTQLCRDTSKGRAWWCRVWIIQEMIVATHLYVCIGSQQMRWNKFVQLAPRLHQWIYGRKFRYLNVFEILFRLYELDELRRRWQEAKYSLSILQLLDIGRRSYTTDARDNIYGLLGLMKPEDRQRICVDYSRRTNHIYAEITVMLIERQRSLDFLVDCFSRKNSRSQPDLPSWVIDFGDFQEKTFRSEMSDLESRADLVLWKETCQTSANITPSICLNTISLKLDLQAIFFDNIVTRTIRPPGPQFSEERHGTEMIRVARDWLRSAVRLLEASSQKIILPSDPRSNLSRNSDIKSNLISVLLQREYLEYEQSLDLAFVEIDRQYDNIGFDSLLQHKDFWRYVYDRSKSEVLFTTASGFYGIAEYGKRSDIRSPYKDPDKSQSACSGDIIAIPLGSRKPWILRKTEAEGEYRLIVDCIIPDIMSGEVITLVKAGKMKVEWLTLA